MNTRKLPDADGPVPTAQPPAPSPLGEAATPSAPPSQPHLPDRYADASTQQLSNLMQMHLLATLQGMYEYAPRRPADEQEEWRKLLTSLQNTLRFVRKHTPTESSSQPELTLGEPAMTAEQIQEFGRSVEKARLGADLSRSELGQRAGLSERTVQNVEEAKTVPTQGTVMRLLSVRELGLSPADVPWLRSESGGFGSAPNCWIAPGYDPLKMFTDLFEILNGSGGSIEQTYAYLDHKSAVNWYQLSNQSQYASKYRLRMPLDRMAERMLEETRHGKLDIVALGSGDGKQEVRLVQHLLDQAEQTRQRAGLRLYLLDISQPLLSAAYQYAAETVGPRGVYVCAIQGNFHHLPQYTLLHHTQERSHRRRVLLMLGSTLSNLEHEPRFFRHCLSNYGPGDLLLLDVLLAYESPKNPEEIRRKDPALRHGLSPTHKEWLSGPLYRYCDDVKHVEIQFALDTQCPVPGSYSLETLATVKLHSGRTKQFSFSRARRYDSVQLAGMLRTLGWELVEERRFGVPGAAPDYSLMLFRRIAAPSA